MKPSPLTVPTAPVRRGYLSRPVVAGLTAGAARWPPSAAAGQKTRAPRAPPSSWHRVLRRRGSFRRQGSEARAPSVERRVGPFPKGRCGAQCSRWGVPPTDILQSAPEARGGGPQAWHSRCPATRRQPPACGGPKEGVPAGWRQATVDAHTSSDTNRSAADRSERQPPLQSESGSVRRDPLLRPAAGGCHRRRRRRYSRRMLTRLK